MPISASRFLGPVNGTESPDTTFERHFSIDELATIWKYRRETVRQLVNDAPGVIKVRNGLLKTMRRYSIPESVARRIHTRLLNPPAL
jgi:hypothetical protein